MVKYADTMVTSKLGVNYVRNVVESAKCIFHKIEQENDLGIDALIELTKDGLPLNKQIAVQIKSGQSYYNSQSDQCRIPTDTHLDYWKNYPLEVYGIVYIPSLKSANWVNIKNYLKNYENPSVIRFDRTRTNVFDEENFNKLFVPSVLKKSPNLTFDEAKSFFHSENPSENYLGLIVLFKNFPNSLEVWDWFLELFKTKPMDEIPGILIYYFAHIPWHPDIWHTGERIKEATKRHVNSYFKKFDKKEVSKLLSFIDEETGISRGSIGQSVHAIIGSLPNCDSTLTEILLDKDIKMFTRESAALIYANRNPKDAINYLKLLSAEQSWLANELITTINDYGEVHLY